MVVEGRQIRILKINMIIFLVYINNKVIEEGDTESKIIVGEDLNARIN